MIKVKLDLWEKQFSHRGPSRLPVTRRKRRSRALSTRSKVLCLYTKDEPEGKKTLFNNSQFKGTLYFFDEDGVAIGKANLGAGSTSSGYCEGEMTGKKDDAFRYCIILPSECVPAKRMELREK